MFESTEIESGLRVKAESLAALKQQQKMAQNASGWVKLPDSDNEKDKKRRKRASIVGNAGTLVKSANGAGAGAGAGGAPGGRGARGPNGGGPSGQQPGNGGPSAVAGEPAENKKIGFGIHELRFDHLLLVHLLQCNHTVFPRPFLRISRQCCFGYWCSSSRDCRGSVLFGDPVHFGARIEQKSAGARV